MPGSKIILLLFFWLCPALVKAATLHVAVASNFKATLSVLAHQYEQASGHKVVISGGSTGKQYAQIRRGAPFDAFFAADAERPKLLELNGHIVTNSRFTYAIGRLALWSNEAKWQPIGLHSLEQDFRHLAMANPKLAPYGLAAQQSLTRLGLWHVLKDKLVLGENIAQAHQFVHTGNAAMGLLAYSQVIEQERLVPGSVLLLPQAPLHDPIVQQAVLLVDTEAGWNFLSFVRSEPAKVLIRQHGYEAP
ncbi:molybdate ABC transporter substrate-binding protein [Aliiglaciecola sp. CAU 1673]|uniref:molybdate ABC transporter substrate-binding protein n=1 Tax=Aliiglaciecola sp. CAU 1673 TaxID=3032595 RepID=UPI0023DCC22D|nr:molybdate ABC transporter substrate-binding protein [Aliiglaciecola sp. CAU 1673]MDF2177393.1 molybdate ABC transporter substrate-binding protein [Aliiglaciecola sp. CAU 1673]